jgi:DNA-directed RNA polymerase subunit RPC12/RpoP
MPVIKEYKCKDCGRIFDSQFPSCIHCGSTEVQRIFITPFGYKSDRTKFSDDNIKSQIEAYGLSDYSNNESTRHDPAKVLQSSWEEVKKGDTVHPSFQSGINVEDIKGKAAGRYAATYHKEDKV